MNTIIRNTLLAGISTGLVAGACTGGIGSDLATSGAGADTGTGSSTESGTTFNPDTSSGNSTGGKENSCGELQFEPELIGVDMIISVDRSGSMNSPSGNTKWDQTEAAFNSFFSSPEAANLGVALRFWPEDSCHGSQCTVAGCETPHVDLGPLSDTAHVQALSNAFATRGPTGATPMSAALGGATQWALNQQQNAEVGRRVVVVFLTDGEPNGCDESTSGITQFASNAYAQQEILTFSIGLEGSNPGVMDAIAVAGNTGPTAYYIGNSNGEQQLLAALQAIQEVAVACTFALPQSPDPTKQLDPERVTISYDPGDGGPPEELPQVTDASECGAEGGWYYDDNANPSIIFLCDASCDQVNDVNRPDGKLSLEAACKLIAE